jgi:hypothetical protein
MSNIIAFVQVNLTDKYNHFFSMKNQIELQDKKTEKDQKIKYG